MPQEQEQRHVYYDSDLNIEAYNLSGIVQKFPNHFHEYYVIGFIEGGRRHLWCRDREYDLSHGDLILFNPRETHRCAPINGEILDYRAVNIPQGAMDRAVRDISGRQYVARFTQPVVFQSEIAESLAALYTSIVDRAPRLEKEEAFYFLLEQVLTEYSQPYAEAESEVPDCKIRMVCDYLEAHYDENVALADLAEMAELSSSWLLHLFTRQTGVSPYRYLQSLRVQKAKELLEQGLVPIEAAAAAGFSDQSHFSRFFKDFIGLTPKQYQRIFAAASDAKCGKGAAMQADPEQDGEAAACGPFGPASKPFEPASKPAGSKEPRHAQESAQSQDAEQPGRYAGDVIRIYDTGGAL